MKTKHYVIIAAILAVTLFIFRRKLMIWFENKKLADKQVVESAVMQQKVNEAVMGLIGGPL